MSEGKAMPSDYVPAQDTKEMRNAWIKHDTARSRFMDEYNECRAKFAKPGCRTGVPV